MRRAAMVTAVVAIAPLSVLGVALTATSWWEGVTMAAGYLLTLGVLREWNLEGYPRQAIFALMLTVTAWLIGALTAQSPISFVPLSLIGGMLIARMRRSRLWIAAFTVGVGAIGATSFAFHPPSWGLAAAYLLTPIVGTLFVVGVILASEHAWLIARRLDRARETEAELAVARERVRFAGDLHDIQGHSLHVIKLKAALAGRLVHMDPGSAEQELTEIRRLADETISHTRTLAYARHDLSLATELENATRLIEAAGIAVAARFDDDAGATPHPLLAHVLREATTNLLRHARPTTVTITVSPDAVEVTNDGAGTDVDAPLNGLARLRERIEDAGGVLRIERPPGGFRVAARIGPRRDEAAKKSRR
ncbi:two-component system sensor histidine kinase DesK [Diaminobutyricimonas aerilata]|uniref:Two-component system sensor histidine kinase DesK n=1 Tax=Diaminobutyricimonas aerilata TaxID=1162967 RepID=A0A2M9CHS4_9MICO|nr:histidine kinase [Diaminobutyricimonas aerilata]PJJ71461.1 two-component system sensor histidine kinase DesK [Diaminobutyricimonas aerilata]